MDDSNLPDLDIHDLVEEFIRLHRSGEGPGVDEFVARYSDHTRQLRELIGPALLLEGLNDAALDSAPQPETHVVAKNLGDFRLLREIGRGGMGVVYEAEQLSLGRLVAVKVLPFAALLNDRQLARFKNEARAAAMLKHPSIVSVYQVGQERGLHYYAMELVEGPDLGQLIPALGSPAPPKDQSADTVPIDKLSTQHGQDRSVYFTAIARLAVQAAEALHHAHHEGVIHRDIKPSNLLLDRTGSVHVSDFGLARIQDDDQLTMTGDLVGTLRYMSPEQASGAQLLDARTDVYSLGVTLYELLTTTAAFQADSRRSLLEQIAVRTPPSPRSHDAAIPMDLDKVVMKAIAKLPEHRYQSARDFADDLTRFLEHRPVLARPAGTFKQLQSWAKRNRALAVACLSTSIAMLALSIVSLYVAANQRHSAHKERKLREELQQSVDHLQQTQHRLGQQSYDAQLTLAFAAHRRRDFDKVDEILREQFPTDGTPDRRGFEWYYLWRETQRVLRRPGIDTSVEIRRIAGIPGTLHFASAQDRRLAVYNADSWDRVWAKSWVNRNVRHLFGPEHDEEAHRSEITDLNASRDGGYIVTASIDKTIKVWESATGRVLATARCDRPALAIHLSGDRLLVAVGDPSGAEAVVHAVNVYELVLDSTDGVTLRKESAFSLAAPLLASVVIFSRDGDVLAAGGLDGIIRLWTFGSDRTQQLIGHTGRISALVFSPHRDGMLASAASNPEQSSEVRLWNVTTGTEISAHTIDWAASTLSFLSVASLAVGGMHGKVEVLELDAVIDGRLLETIAWHESSSQVTAIHPSPSDHQALFAYANRKLRAYETELSSSPDAASRFLVLDMDVLQDQGLCVTADYDGRVRLREVRSGAVLQSITPEPPIASCFAVDASSDGHHILFAGGNWRDSTQHGGAYIWNRQANECRPLHVDTLPKLTGACLAAAFGPKNRRAAIAVNRDVIVVDANSGDALCHLKGHSDNISWLCWCPVTDVIASLTWGPTREIKLWSGDTGQEIGELPVPMEYVLARGCFSHDGRLFAVGVLPGDVLIFDVARRVLVRRLQGHVDWVPGVAFSSDDRRIATCAWDRTVRLWHTSTGNLLNTFEADLGRGWTTQFALNDTLLVAGGANATGGGYHAWNAATPGEADAQRSCTHPVRRHGITYRTSPNDTLTAGQSE